jgi:hypothetical protein
MRDQPWFVNLWCSLGEYPPGSIKSSVTWATGYTKPLQPPPAAIDKVETGNQWNWDRAREFFYIFLTGRDFQQEVVAITEAQRKA